MTEIERPNHEILYFVYVDGEEIVTTNNRTGEASTRIVHNRPHYFNERELSCERSEVENIKNEILASHTFNGSAVKIYRRSTHITTEEL